MKNLKRKKWTRNKTEQRDETMNTALSVKLLSQIEKEYIENDNSRHECDFVS